MKCKIDRYAHTRTAAIVADTKSPPSHTRRNSGNSHFHLFCEVAVKGLCHPNALLPATIDAESDWSWTANGAGLGAEILTFSDADAESPPTAFSPGCRTPQLLDRHTC